MAIEENSGCAIRRGPVSARQAKREEKNGGHGNSTFGPVEADDRPRLYNRAMTDLPIARTGAHD